jgi:hypothetical protein
MNFQESLSHFCHIFGRKSGRMSSRTLCIIEWHFYSWNA